MLLPLCTSSSFALAPSSVKGHPDLPEDGWMWQLSLRDPAQHVWVHVHMCMNVYMYGWERMNVNEMNSACNIKSWE